MGSKVLYRRGNWSNCCRLIAISIPTATRSIMCIITSEIFLISIWDFDSTIPICYTVEICKKVYFFKLSHCLNITLKRKSEKLYQLRRCSQEPEAYPPLFSYIHGGKGKYGGDIVEDNKPNWENACAPRGLKCS